MSIFGWFHFRKRKHPDLASEIMRVMPHSNQAQSSFAGPQNELLLRFFRGEEDERIHHTLSRITEFSDEEMEMYHDFIQWIFPTMEQSEYHPSAPTIDAKFAHALHQDDCTLAGYCKGCRRYFRYMGLECKGNGDICRIPNTPPFWQLPGHNYLRITRVLNSLRQTGHEGCCKALYAQMMQILEADPTNYVGRTTLEYWARTQKYKKIIFLDFDGVMDNGKYVQWLVNNNLPEKDKYGVLFDPECVKNLARIVAETGADIVISSSWKDDMSFAEILRMWEDRHLPGKVIDTTPSISRHRGDEIDQWLHDCDCQCQYVILDDLPAEQFDANQMTHFIQVNGYLGQTAEDATKAIEILNQPI